MIFKKSFDARIKQRVFSNARYPLQVLLSGKAVDREGMFCCL